MTKVLCQAVLVGPKTSDKWIKKVREVLHDNFVVQFMITNWNRCRLICVNLCWTRKWVFTLMVIISWKTRLHNGHSFVTFDHSKMQLKQNIWEQQGRLVLRRIAWRQIATRYQTQPLLRQSILSSFGDIGRFRLLREDGTTVWVHLKSIPELRSMLIFKMR